MHIIRDDAEERLASFLSLLPAERGGWRGQMLKLGEYLHGPDGYLLNLLMAGIVNDRLAGTEGAAFFCADGDVVLVCRQVARRVLDEVMDELHAHIQDIHPSAPPHAVATLYDLSVDWRDLLAITRDKCARKQQTLRAQTTPLPSPVRSPAASPDPAAKPPVPHVHAAAEPIHDDLLSGILLVDDDPLSLRLTQHALRAAGRVAMAETAAAALEQFRARHPRLVFLDIGLPDRDGHLVLEDMLAQEPDTYVVMLSANSTRSAIMRAMQSGARGFVGKPFSQEKLWHYVQQAGLGAPLPAAAAR